jgi:hypothetical protein
MSINRPAVKRSPDPRSPRLFRRRPGRILIGVVAMTVGVAALIPAISSAGAMHGNHKLVFKINGQARQNVVGAGGIAVTVECPAEACTVVASAKSTSPRVSTGRVRTRVAGGGSARMMLPLSANDGEKLQSALAAGKKPTLIVTAMARDGYGAEVPLELTVTALRG